MSPTDRARRLAPLAVAVLLVTACAPDAPSTGDSVAMARDAAAVRAPVPPRPVAPMPAYYVARGICPFECCTYGPWVARSGGVAYAEERQRETAALHFAAGDTLVADTGNVHILEPGRVLLRQRADRAFPPGFLSAPTAAGDTVLLLEYRGEGYHNVRYRGRDVVLEQFWNDERGLATRLAEPRQEWWARVTAVDGARGWVSMTEANFAGVDRCG